MAGFKNIREWVQSEDDGKSWISMLRKRVSGGMMNTAGHWFDYSTASGYPVANYYASAPFIAARVGAEFGLYIPTVAPEKQFIRKLMLMSAAAGAANIQNQNQIIILMDYLLYYPFIELEAVGEQTLINTVNIPRYVDGEGVRMMMVSQASGYGSGRFIVNYTNQDGVAGRITPETFCTQSLYFGSLLSSTPAAIGGLPFIPLQSGDTGVRSIQSVTMTVLHSGLAALVLVKPLQISYIREECRVDTPGSFGDASEIERIRMQSGTVEIVDGAVLSFIGQAGTGYLLSSTLVGTLETVWR